ncbi:MAG TPA: amino acid ABC transporter permease [Defluviitoga tunisiensis]|uniref:Histidine transport system permease protein n=1 Tax=Defluviitoga tunisiensis TaxID=1006576 RepID=A0A0C7NZ57_DEFTU|nr:amino acid ABC transporter permease [Defluviitoga tunisiensis]MDD3601095.1 amino acid ABC transporter permease [Defluviitoga tunisiensis]CEP78573.1 histidine transport system permease protein [Defluviitoga tunisiensis]HOB55049.1 amino acid ABC transporter permease [Defluviitoga tunisiensis]HOK15730.1 amino acid ABC transporter permease [Defluviitoga tunisiensis]HOL85952.1 amino acid ABC transporter permease [Defluviitoga tunisiensis]
MENLKIIIDSLPHLLKGTLVTLELAFFSIVLGFVVSIIVALGQLYGNKFVRAFFLFYERLLRSLPELVILFLIFYGLPLIGIRLNPLFASIVGLGLRSSAYQSQIFRGAISSLPKGQVDAAYSLGMTKFQTFFNVIFPQAFRISLSGWTNEAAVVLKDTSLAYALGVIELLRQGTYIIAVTNKPLLIYLICGLIYFVLTFSLSKGLGYVEKKLEIPGYEVRRV